MPGCKIFETEILKAQIWKFDHKDATERVVCALLTSDDTRFKVKSIKNKGNHYKKLQEGHFREYKKENVPILKQVSKHATNKINSLREDIYSSYS